MSAHRFGIIIDGRQRTHKVGNVAGNDCDDLRRIADDVRGANAIIDLDDRHRQPVRRIQRHIDVMHSFEFERLGHVDFHDDLFGALNKGSGITQRCGRNQVAIFGDCTDFDDRNIDIAAQIAVTGHLRGMAQMQVSISDFSAVDLFADRIIGLIGKPTGNAFDLGQGAVHFFTNGSTGPEIDLERRRFHPFRQCQRHSLRVAGGSKAAGADVHPRFDQGCRRLGRGDLRLQRTVAYPVFDFNHAFSPPRIYGLQVFLRAVALQKLL